MANDATKLNHEPVQVIFNSVDLGICEPGGVSVSWQSEWVFQQGAQTGNRNLQGYFKGSNPTISVSLAQIDDLSSWEILFPTADNQTSSSDTRIAGDLAAANSPWVGQKATVYAKKLVLRPVRGGDLTAEYLFDVVFPLAICTNPGDMTLDLDSPMLLPMEFSTLFDPAASEGEQHWFRGLETGTWA